MRRILLIVLVALLPLQWSGAAAAVRCLHGGAGHGHAADGAAVHGHASHHGAVPGHAGDGPDGAHAASDDPSRVTVVASVDARAGATHDPGSGHAHGAGHHDVEAPAAAEATSAAHGVLADLADCGHADCGGCCHGGGTLPAASQRVPASPAFEAVPVARVVASPASPALDGPFRPPRVRSA